MTRTIEEVMNTENPVPSGNMFHSVGLEDDNSITPPADEDVVVPMVDAPDEEQPPAEEPVEVPQVEAPSEARPDEESSSEGEAQPVEPDEPKPAPKKAAPSYRFRVTAGRKKKILFAHPEGTPLRTLFDLAEQAKVGLNLIALAMNMPEEKLIEALETPGTEGIDLAWVGRVNETLELGISTDLYPTSDSSKILPILLVLAELTKSRRLNPQLAP